MENGLKNEEREFLLNKYSSLDFSKRTASIRLKEVVTCITIPTLN